MSIEKPTDPYLNSAREFLLEMPLYKLVVLNEAALLKTYEFMRSLKPLDAYCIVCKRSSTFEKADDQFDMWPLDGWREYSGFVARTLSCTRNHHIYVSYFHKADDLIKVGQFPSVADLQIPALKKYRKVLGADRYMELTRAVGLAAHGVGIGSFIYLRRIFEGLIEEAHKIAEVTEGFRQEEYNKARLEEKILIIKDQLPSFLVQNRKIYPILSKGVHQLAENECLEYFAAVKGGIELILDEKIAQLEREQKQKEVAASLNKIKQSLAEK
jgi:hypothetical protein